MDHEREIPRVIEHPERMTYLADGQTQIEGHVHHEPGMSRDEIREEIAQANGIEIDDVHIRERSRQTARRTGGVAFSGSKWNSSWDPRAGDPSLN